MDDLISRQAAIDVVKRLMGDSELSRTVQVGLHILPSAQSEKRTEERMETQACDLISRQAAIEYFMINTNWHDEEGHSIDDWDEKRKLLEDYFNGVPSAQPEIIHCKDCKWWERESVCEGHCHEIDLHNVDEDHYCGWAEKETV